ncbi:acetylxylan esterase [Dyadobacter sandarakinus]|uniref:Acetylxylan esterase n=2 Tax=Dyadobacter sandarakinus TaxID=2747268 RepID=A0ABX7IDZ8_9BACT|nr:acetylxylan esterase [Dyadobacter sandarakinus]
MLLAAGTAVYGQSARTAAPAQQAANRPTVVAGIPVNYSEDSTGTYVLPDLLKCSDGQMVTSAKMWTEKRRPELLKMVEETQFGKMPPAPGKVRASLLEKETIALQGKAIRRQVRIYLTTDTTDHYMDLLVYTPVATKKPVPLLLNISFLAYNQIIEDEGLHVGNIWKDGKKIPATQPGTFGKMNIDQFMDAEIGFATVYYGDIEPDFKDGLPLGIRSRYLKAGQAQPAPDEWGAIAAWGWGLSRALDYLQTDRKVDAGRVALQGASRLGKTVLWAGIRDTRFAMVIASISGEGGAALARRNYGETIAHITDPSRYLYQFAANYHNYADQVQNMPFDAHALVALMAPRPLLLQTGSTDYWSDPKGEYLSALAAAPVYRLFNKTAPVNAPFPDAGDTALLMSDLGYYMHDGGHTVLPEDWTLMIRYMQKFLR